MGALFNIEEEFKPHSIDDMKNIVESAGGDWNTLIVAPKLVFPTLQEALAHKMPNGKYKDMTFQQIWDADKSPRGFIAYLALKSDRQNDEKAAAQIIYSRLGGVNIPGVPMEDGKQAETNTTQSVVPQVSAPTQNVSAERQGKIDKINAVFSTKEKYVNGGFDLIINDMKKFGNGKTNIQDFTDAELDALLKGCEE